jgi:hypothetical protein
MNKKTKNIIIWSAVGAVLLGTTLYFAFRKPKSDEEENNDAKVDDAVKSLIGKNVYPSSSTGFTNVRTTPKIECIGFFAWGRDLCYDTNVIVEAKERPFGTILSSTTDDKGQIWYRVKLKTPVKGQSEGFARWDAVSLN